MDCIPATSYSHFVLAGGGQTHHEGSRLYLLHFVTANCFLGKGKGKEKKFKKKVDQVYQPAS